MYSLTALIVLTVGFFAYQYWKYRASDQGAPYVAMEHPVVERILKLANLKETDLLYDLGSGDGRIAINAALTYHCRAVGIEIDKLRYLYSQYQRFILRLSDKVSFINENIFTVNLSEATVCIIYLTEQANVSLEQKLLTELKPGTLVIAPSFPFTNWNPIYVDKNPSLNTPWGPTFFYEIGKSNPQIS